MLKVVAFSVACNCRRFGRKYYRHGVRLYDLAIFILTSLSLSLSLSVIGDSVPLCASYQSSVIYCVIITVVQLLFVWFLFNTVSFSPVALARIPVMSFQIILTYNSFKKCVV